MSYLSAELIANDHGLHYVVRRDDGRASRVIVSPSLKTSAVFGIHVSALEGSLATFSRAVPALVEKLSEKGWRGELPRQLKTTASAFTALQSAAIARKSELDDQRSAWLAPLKPLDPALAAEARAYLRSLKTPDMLRAAIDNSQLATAALAAPAIAGLTPDLTPVIENALILKNLTDRYAPQTIRKPEQAAILGSGPDMVAAEGFAKSAVKAHTVNNVEIDDVGALLNQVVGFAALAANEPIDSGYAILVS